MFSSVNKLQAIETNITHAEKLLHNGFPEISAGLSSQELRLNLLKKCEEEIALNNNLIAILLEEQLHIPELSTQSSVYTSNSVGKLSAQQLEHLSTRVYISNQRLKHLYTKSLLTIEEYERRQLSETRKRSSPSSSLGSDTEECRPSPKQACLVRHNVNLNARVY